MQFATNLPFPLGESAPGTDDDGNLITPDWLGKKFLIAANNISASGPIKDRLTGRQIVAVPMRNTAGQAMLGKRVVQFERTAGYRSIDSFDGYAATLAEKGIGVLDEFLPAAGVADDDIAWVIVEGPVTVLTPDAGAAFNGDITVGAQLVAATAATTGTTVAGRLSNVTLPGQTGSTQAFQMAANQVGKALSARTTGETGADLLIHATIAF